ncbi:hypothetical protein C8A03DRAFT_32061 [Achaetomium macrosporum]|uniref:Tetratricopeptide-like helical n=1 Tax=Achaetomium macrosporum TaxID=79813 RepID=A0AAN7H8D1_9PEZI|nr:hypothetical protein C8A03DRAFT_32061 [Achaetomium macrosporum]
MFSSRAPIPAKRAARALLQNNIVIPPLHHSQALPTRQYAKQVPIQPMRAPSTLKHNRTASKPTTHHLLFQESDVPALESWEECLSQPEQRPYRCLSAEESHNVALRFASVARRTKESSAWKGALLRDHNIDPRTLYCTAIPLLNIAKGKARHMGLYMLMTASGFGYTPATLSLIRLLLNASDEVYPRLKAEFGDAAARFIQLLRTERSPDVLTLRGLWLLRDGHGDAYALSYFDEALAAARDIRDDDADRRYTAQQGPREPRWAYEGSCHLKRGLILAKQGRTDEAIASFKVAALELDLADGYAELAKLLPRDTRERETYLLRAAQGGNFEACRLLALDMAEKAADPRLSWSDRNDAAGMAREWSQVVPDLKMREELAAQVAERARDVIARAKRGFLWKLADWAMGKSRV